MAAPRVVEGGVVTGPSSPGEPVAPGVAGACRIGSKRIGAGNSRMVHPSLRMGIGVGASRAVLSRNAPRSRGGRVSDGCVGALALWKCASSVRLRVPWAVSSITNRDRQEHGEHVAPVRAREGGHCRLAAACFGGHAKSWSPDRSGKARQEQGGLARCLIE